MEKRPKITPKPRRNLNIKSRSFLFVEKKGAWAILNIVGTKNSVDIKISSDHTEKFKIPTKIITNPNKVPE